MNFVFTGEVWALAATKSAPPTMAVPDDHAIGDQLLAELKAKNWVDPSSADIIARGGLDACPPAPAHAIVSRPGDGLAIMCQGCDGAGWRSIR